MARRSVLAIALLLVALLAVPSVAAAIDRAQLASSLQRESNRLGSASGALVVDLDTGEVLYSRRADKPLIPASNEKLFTTAAALLRLTPTGTIATTVQPTPGAVIDEDGRLDGDLYLVGGGDPSLGDLHLKALVEDLDALGLRKVTGSVRGDESTFDTRRGGPRTSFRADLDIGGWLGGLVYAHGRTGPGGPAVVAAARLQALLKAAGVTFGRAARAGTVDGEPDAAAAQATVPLASVQSATIGDLSATVNKPSDNFYAEMFTKLLGARFGSAGSTSAGLGVMRTTLAELGIRPRLADGSGLSRANRTTPRQVVKLLDAMAERPEGEAFRLSLPRPGEGTLRKRMRGTAAAKRCRAKTGTLNGVSALSGYCTAANGHTLAFSLIENRVYAPAAKRIEDRMVPVIARYG